MSDSSLASDHEFYKGQLAKIDEQILRRNHGEDVGMTHAQLNARQARITGYVRAIEAEQARRKWG